MQRNTRVFKDRPAKCSYDVYKHALPAIHLDNFNARYDFIHDADSLVRNCSDNITTHAATLITYTYTIQLQILPIFPNPNPNLDPTMTLTSVWRRYCREVLVEAIWGKWTGIQLDTQHPTPSTAEPGLQLLEWVRAKGNEWMVTTHHLIIFFASVKRKYRSFRVLTNAANTLLNLVISFDIRLTT